MKRTFEKRGLGYVLRVPDLSVQLAVDHLTRSRGELHGELRVSCAMPGIRATGGNVHQARFNLSSTTSRTSLGKHLAIRAAVPEVDWTDLLEDFCRRVLVSDRAGDPVERVGALPVPLRETYRVDPILPENQVTILYGDGGVGKSTLAAALAVSVETGISVVAGWIPRRAPVLYLDWEGGRNAINRRVRGIAMGSHLPDVAQVDFMDCRRRGPLHGFAEEVARLVDEHGYGLVVVDSVGMASGTGGEGGDANETAIRLFAAFGFLATTVLAIDHISKASAELDNRPARPYGSAYKGFLARQTFELRRSKRDAGGSVIGLYHTKSNDGPELAPQALVIEHGDDGAIRYERLEVMPTELAKPLRQADQVYAALAGGHLDAADIAELTDLPENTVRAVLSRHKGLFRKLPSGKWEVLPRAS